jgi:hypothetical protein
MIIVSINVHEKPTFLMQQIENISAHILSKFTIILNCNTYMNDALQAYTLPPNVVVNPEIINKTWGTGTIVQGIYSNLCYANANYTFDFFLILSSRNMFFRPFQIADILKLQKPIDINLLTCPHWYHWPKVRSSLLAKYYIEQDKPLCRTAHEGLIFSHQVCKTVEKFMNTHPSIKTDTFVFPSILEEFTLQNIAIHESVTDPFVYIGRGAMETLMEPPTGDTKHFVYKTVRVD